MGTLILPFKGRNISGAYNQNLLWQDGSVYVMDNHRAAMWCWLRHVDPDQPHSIMHIDRHYDTLYSQMDTWLKALPSLQGLSIQQYLDVPYKGLCMDEIPIIRWDNYLSIYLELFAANIAVLKSITHHDGDVPRFQKLMKAELWELPANFKYWIRYYQTPWILNIDLDVFFCDGEDATAVRLVDDSFITDLARDIRKMRDEGRIGVITICLTPDDNLTGGWEETLRLAKLMCHEIGVNFDFQE